MAIPAPEIEWTEECDLRTIANDPAYGTVLRGVLGQEKVRLFHLRWKGATQAQKDALMSEWDGAKGEAGETTYTPTPIGEGSAVTVRFAGRPVARRRGHLWEMACTLRENYTPY